MTDLTARVVLAHRSSLVRLEGRQWQLGAQERLVVAGGGQIEVEGEADIACLDTSEAVRLLAFMDHGLNFDRRGQRGESAAIATIEMVEEPGRLLQWITALRVNNDQGADALFNFWAATEPYNLVRFVLAEFGKGQSVQELAHRYGLSTAHFRRKCRQGLGRSIKTEMRLLRARQSLMEYSTGQNTMTSVAVNNGYCSLSHFCSDIKSLLGVAPREVFQVIRRD